MCNKEVEVCLIMKQKYVSLKIVKQKYVFMHKYFCVCAWKIILLLYMKMQSLYTKMFDFLHTTGTKKSVISHATLLPTLYSLTCGFCLALSYFVFHSCDSHLCSYMFVVLCVVVLHCPLLQLFSLQSCILSRSLVLASSCWFRIFVPFFCFYFCKVVSLQLLYSFTHLHSFWGGVLVVKDVGEN